MLTTMMDVPLSLNHLMERAGAALCSYARHHWPQSHHWWIFVGPGNTGLIAGGAQAAVAEDNAHVSAAGKTNIIAGKAVARGDLRPELAAARALGARLDLTVSRAA